MFRFRFFWIFILASGSYKAAFANSLRFEYGVADWVYEEQEISVRHQGRSPSLGVQWQISPQVGDKGAWRLDGRLASGKANYIGSGSMNDQRVVATQVAVSYEMPLTGTGWRWAPLLAYDRLYNDARGITTTGEYGYRRLNERWSTGLQTIYRTDEKWEWRAGLSRLLSGTQTSYLEDVGGVFSNLPPVINKQPQGIGLMLGACRTMREFALCSQWQSWNVSQSDTLKIQTENGRYSVYEPENRSSLLTLTLQYRYD
jgi:hypothetical protein